MRTTKIEEEKKSFVGAFWPRSVVEAVNEESKRLFMSRSRFLLRLTVEHLNLNENKKDKNKNKGLGAGTTSTPTTTTSTPEHSIAVTPKVGTKGGTRPRS